MGFCFVLPDAAASVVGASVLRQACNANDIDHGRRPALDRRPVFRLSNRVVGGGCHGPSAPSAQPYHGLHVARLLLRGVVSLGQHVARRGRFRGVLPIGRSSPTAAPTTSDVAAPRHCTLRRRGVQQCRQCVIGSRVKFGFGVCIGRGCVTFVNTSPERATPPRPSPPAGSPHTCRCGSG